MLTRYSNFFICTRKGHFWSKQWRERKLRYYIKTDLNGENYTILHELKYTNPGAQPDNSSLCEVKGTLYGTTGDGGEFENGVLYAYHIATETYTKLHDFEKVTSGRSPYSNVILAKNGKLYGTTLYGGLYDLGILV